MNSPFRIPLSRALAYSLEHLDGLDTMPVGAPASLAELKAALDKPLTDEGLDPELVIDDLVADTAGGIQGTASGRFHGWVIGGSLPSALAADWLTSAWDQNAAGAALSPASAVVEEITGTWLKDLLGLPPTASFAFTTGSQTAHVVCLSAARSAVLHNAGWDVEQQGLAGSPPIAVLATSLRHSSVDRAVRFVGIGQDAIQPLEGDSNFQITPETLKAALSKNVGRPIILILQAGELCTGTYDRFDELIDVAAEAQAWVHIDGAIGLWAAASPTHRSKMAGAAKADSWVTDGHKWLNVPYDSGFAFVAHSDAHRNAMGFTASYMKDSEEIRDPKDWNIEMSRRARGFAVYAAIRQLGREGIADLVDRCCQFAVELVTGIGALPHTEILFTPTINQGMVRFLDPKLGATNTDHDARTDKIIAAIVASGEAFFGGVTWEGQRAMRISVSNWQTTQEDVTRTIAAVEQALSTTE